MGKIKDLKDQRFGKLKVIEYAYLDKDIGLSIWLCKCDCGKEKYINSQILKKCVSCGCYKNELATKRIKKYCGSRKKEGIFKDGKRHPAYSTWCSMKSRCYNPNCKEFRWYGSKGIILCEEWNKSPEVFIKWCDENGYKKGLSIDRIDSSKNYEPSNCQFLLRTENTKKIRQDNLKKGYVYSRGRTPSLTYPPDNM